VERRKSLILNNIDSGATGLVQEIGIALEIPKFRTLEEKTTARGADPLHRLLSKLKIV